MLPKWEDRFSIHNNKIDLQHKKLFQLAQKAYMLGLKGKGINPVEIKVILAEFFNYIKVHFADEESYMQEIGYPGLEKHKVLHKTIVEELAQAIKTIKNVHDMQEKLKIVAHDWLLGHILHDDMLIEEYRVKAAVKLSAEVEEEFAKPKSEEYLYECGCSGKIHKISPEVHETIQSGKKSFRCSKCKEAIRLIAI